MRRLATLTLLGILAASPALAQQQAPRPQAPAAAAPAAQAPAPARPAAAAPAAAAPAAAAPARAGFGTGHALALGAGMFGGAVLGSAMIHGGSFAAAVGAVAGLAAGHWYYMQHRNEID
jgi:hypothetical protein